ncbi:unnamed protein product [Caretta caretta]
MAMKRQYCWANALRVEDLALQEPCTGCSNPTPLAGREAPLVSRQQEEPTSVHSWVCAGAEENLHLQRVNCKAYDHNPIVVTVTDSL